MDALLEMVAAFISALLFRMGTALARVLVIGLQSVCLLFVMDLSL